MARIAFNSPQGYSVGDTPANVILANGDITTGNATFTGNVSVLSGNVAAANVLTDHLMYANGVAWNFLQAGGTNTQVQFNNQGALGGTANLTFDSSTNLLKLTNGNANLANILSSNIQVNGNVSANWFIGNVQGNISGNIIVPGNNTAVLFNDQGDANSSDAFTFNKSSNVLTVGGNLVVGNVSGANLISSNYFTGVITVASNAQPNITSVGTLVSVNVTGNANTGNVNTGNLNLTGQVTSSFIPSNDNTYDLGNSTYHWRNVYVSSNVVFSGGGYIRPSSNVLQTDAFYAANNISAGTLTSRGLATFADVGITGNLTVGGSTTYVNSTNTSIEDPLIDLGGSGNGANSTGWDGMDRGMVFHNWTATTSGQSFNAFMGWKTSAGEFQVLSNVTDITTNVVTGTLGNIRGNVLFGNLTGTVLTASQTNITTLGTLTNLTIAGNLQVNTSANINSLKAGGLTYPTTDGSSGQFLQTYGNGVLTWQTVSTSSISNGSSNVAVLNNGNVNISSTGNANVVTVTGTGAVVNGTLSATGNVSFTNGNTTLYGTYTTVDHIQIDSLYQANGRQTGNSTGLHSAEYQTHSTGTQQLIARVSMTGIRGVEFFVKGEDTTGTKYSVATVSAVHDGTNVDYTVYGVVTKGSGSPGTLAVTTDGLGNMFLVASPTSSNPTTWTAQYRTI